MTKQRSIYKTILSKFINASLIPVLFIEISLIGALFWMNAKQSEVTQSSLQKISSDAFSEIAELTGTQIEQQFVQAKHEISQLSHVASNFFSYPKRYQMKDASFYFDQGFFRNGKRAGLSSVYTTNISKLSKTDEIQLQLLSLLFPYVKHLVDANRDLLQGAWVNISKYYALFYPKIDVPNELSSDLDVTQQAFYYKADAKHNPKREIVFISLYKETWATQFGQMGAYLSPIYAKDRFIGVIGVNVTVKKIAQTFMRLQLPFNAYAMLIDSEKRLLISSDEARSAQDTGVHSYYNNYKRSLANQELMELEPMRSQSSSKDSMVTFSQKIKGTDFSIMFCADNKDIYGPVQRRYEQTKTIGYFIVIAIALFYILYFLWMLKSVRGLALKIYQPLSRMVEFSSQLGSSEMAELSKTDIIELERLNQNFIQTHKRLISLIYYDQKTGLYNHKKLRSDVKYRSDIRLVFVKLNNFDQYNNLFGPDMSSFALKEMVKEIKQCAHKEAVLYRENKDTIAMLIEGKEKEALKEDINKIIEILEDKILLFQGLDVNLSIRAAVTMNTHDDGIDLLSQAHIALAEAVKRSLNEVVVYEDIHGVTKQYQENLVWSKHVKDALLEKRLVAFFQPIYSYKSRKIEKFESLVRMELNGEIISPFRFLDAAQSSGKLHDITLTMVDQVFEIAEAYPTMEFSVNTSFVDFEEAKLLDYVKRKLAETQVDSSKIIFELLETETFADGGNISAMITELKSLGFKIAIDDFGTGHSNFAHIATIDVDYIKIDGMFIRNLDSDALSAKMVKTLVSFSKSIDALTIGEFVHNKSVFEAVEELGVDYAQGYYKSPPLSKEELKKMMG
jgi:EAL domain-containing protein (putative c-di-GMP-specific phosphodiesterase class I)/GGDEF domain-containing protein